MGQWDDDAEGEDYDRFDNEDYEGSGAEERVRSVS